MNENENKNKPEEIEEPDYIGMIQDLKANTVPKEAYKKVVEENSRLMDTLINGGTIEAPEPVDIKQLRDSLFGNGQGMSNLEYCSKALKLREAIMAEGKPDPLAPQGKLITASDEDLAAAQKVADALQHCVEVADGDNLVFTNELQRIMIDGVPMRRRT